MKKIAINSRQCYLYMSMFCDDDCAMMLLAGLICRVRAWRMPSCYTYKCLRACSDN